MDEIFVKICGITCIVDALEAAVSGADAIGLNLVPSSPRRIEPEDAREIARAVAGRLPTVAVVADLPLSTLRGLAADLGVDRLQLHGHESPETLAALLPGAYKAVRIGGADDVALARSYGGDRVLVDAKVGQSLGGTGEPLDWELVKSLARERRLILAGGLTPDNVGEAVRHVRPWGVDVASGVEVRGNPRRKDAERMLAFIRRARGG